MTYRIGVDIGGSFTDFAVLDERDNSIRTLKVLSRPDSPGSEITTGLSQLRDNFGIEPAEVHYFTHGTTVGVNAVIQRKGVKLALFTTEAFEDVLELARLKIPHIHDLFSRRPEPLISRDRVFPIKERTDSQGRILQPVDPASVMAAVQQAKALGCEGVVVSFLHAYRNGDNEARVREMITELAPELLTSCSGEIWPIIREYERTITATINAYVQPKVINYLGAFERALSEMGVPVPPRITKSNGGVMSVEQAKAECVQMILSGTASGVIGAGYIADQCGYDKLLSLDIGGTSADVAVIIDGRPEYGSGETIGEFQIFIPSVSVTSVGQGGGSLAWIDRLGVLQVGPDSAGSLPGPVCYGRGGEQATVTDAFAACGLLGHGALGYSAVSVDSEAARRAIALLAKPLGITIEEAAETIIQLAVSSMYSDTSGLISRFGIDPREFYFLAFGGAGPMMGCYLARELNMKGVVIPPTPGVLSALGGLIADLKNDFIRTLYRDLNASALSETLAAAAQLRQEAEGWLRREHGADLPYSLLFSADMRYRGQSFEIEVPLQNDWLELSEPSAERLAWISAAFNQQHLKIFGHSDATAAIQIINLRLVISSPTARPALKKRAYSNEAIVPQSTASAWVDGAQREVRVVRREQLLAGQCFAGPAIVAQDDCTTCVPTGMQVDVDTFGNLIITPTTQRVEELQHGY
ncbi:hydantoinase/oxoprolinase family protein [Rouxiella sp. S1S-2]|uniref:hydantoinase/oxoprolinase family protein n=1 Tax=Rouxiella sp. S1S-2 TaxID=2653856 RepID=UPI001265527B|nr:hydantoinase/oxoprolinase family protein [Rouxiella sp. S1S-2]KAB7896949.1 hydantoinase/oxoprolinase family protein [Rouxiella sp. S1S-2]